MTIFSLFGGVGASRRQRQRARESYYAFSCPRHRCEILQRVLDGLNTTPQSGLTAVVDGQLPIAIAGAARLSTIYIQSYRGMQARKLARCIAMSTNVSNIKHHSPFYVRNYYCRWANCNSACVFGRFYIRAALPCAACTAEKYKLCNCAAAHKHQSSKGREEHNNFERNQKRRSEKRNAVCKVCNEAKWAKSYDYITI